MDSLLVLQWATFVATLFMIFSGIPPCYQIYKSRDASNAPIQFYLLAIANGIGWVHYGYLQSNFNLTVLNGFALALNFLCVLLYALYCKQLTAFFAQTSALTAYFACLYSHLYMRAGDQFVQHLGMSCSLVNVAFLLLPLLDIVRLLQTRDVSRVHLPIQVAGCLCTSLWTAYGFALGDWNVALPNLLGMSLAACGLLVRLIVAGGESPKKQKRS